jgi:hypothetical protein
MNIEKYPLKSESSFTSFEFISEGSKGIIRKIIQYQETNEPGLYNLAFGDINGDTSVVDDTVISNNGDSEKVLATVVASLYAFSEKYTSSFIYATGSTRSRTRLYRMGISKFYHEMVKDFYLYGQIGDEFFEFEIGKDYIGFLAQRKID